jgi:3-oxo-5alpha-steroid 4-dehydrogenase
MTTSDTFFAISAAEAGPPDSQTDVAVVGFGAAGTAAAIAACDTGAEVMVLERMGGPGGAAALAGGIIYLGGGTAVQRACGFEDSPANMAAFLRAACGPEVDEAKIVAYTEHSVEHFDWLVAQGLEFEHSFSHETQMETVGTEGLVYSGGEDAWPFVEIATPAPRGHLIRTPGSTGRLLMTTLTDAAIARGPQVSFDTRVERLIVEGGRVIGVVARRHGSSLVIHARGGVILTAGGFIYNDDMVRRNAPALLGASWKVGTEADDGRGIQMAQAVGARVKNMHAGEVALPIIPPRKLMEGIIINSRGQRFINEDTYNGRMGQAALFEQQGESYLVIDEASYVPNWMGLRATWVSESVSELEEEIGLPAGSLEATLEVYNRHAALGEDPVAHKDASLVHPLLGPLGVFDLRPTAIPYAAFTLGGLETTVAGEVLDLAGEPIPGLLAAGRTTSGVCSFGYCSGLSIGDSTMFGRFAGATAARAAKAAAPN